MPIFEDFVERYNLQDKRNLFASIGSGALVISFFLMFKYCFFVYESKHQRRKLDYNYLVV